MALIGETAQAGNLYSIAIIMMHFSLRDVYRDFCACIKLIVVLLTVSWCTGLACPVANPSSTAFAQAPGDSTRANGSSADAGHAPVHLLHFDNLTLRNADLRAVACQLVEEKFRSDCRWKKDDEPQKEVGFDPMSDTEILSLIPMGYVKSLIKHGQLNLHQVGHSRGQHHKWWREQVEDISIGVHLPLKPPEIGTALRPKYGFVNFLKPCGFSINPDASRIGHDWLRYGEIVIVYKNDVKHRTTYTYGDSIELMSEKPGLIGIADASKPRPICHMIPPHRSERPIEYVEAQVWGPVDISDISEFRIPKDCPRSLADTLRATRVPVNYYDRGALETLRFPHEPYRWGFDRSDKSNVNSAN